MAYFADLTAHHKIWKWMIETWRSSYIKQCSNNYWTWKSFETNDQNMVQSFSNQDSAREWGLYRAPAMSSLGISIIQPIFSLWSPRPKKLVGLSRVEAWTLQGNAGVPMPKRWWSKLAARNIRHVFLCHPTEWGVFLPALIPRDLSWPWGSIAGGMGLVDR